MPFGVRCERKGSGAPGSVGKEIFFFLLTAILVYGSKLPRYCSLVNINSLSLNMTICALEEKVDNQAFV